MRFAEGYAIKELDRSSLNRLTHDIAPYDVVEIKSPLKQKSDRRQIIMWYP